MSQLLDNVRVAITKRGHSLASIKEALEVLLSWLVANNTDENCRRVDLFVLLEIGDHEKAKLPQSFQEILFDIGANLYDTHTSPEVARNFESTPEQLLERVSNLSVHEARTQ